LRLIDIAARRLLDALDAPLTPVDAAWRANPQ
jgi:hypothetical protein